MNRQSRSGPESYDSGGDSFDDLTELRHEAQALQEQFAVTGDHLSGQVGTGGVGAVQVTVGGDGRVTAVEINRSWRSMIAENQLEDAVVEAVMNASMHRLATWAEAVGTPDDENVGNSDDSDRNMAQRDQQPGTPERLHDGRDARTAANEVLNLLEGIEDELDNLEQQVTQAVSQSVDGYSPSHTVSVSATAAGQVTAVSIQRRFLRDASAERLERELYAAFQAAYQRAGVLTASTALGDGKLARIHELVQQQATELGRNDKR